MFNLDYDNRVVEITEPVDGRKFAFQLKAALNAYNPKSYSSPIDLWDAQDDSVMMCETENWTVKNTDKLLYTTWINWKHG